MGNSKLLNRAGPGRAGGAIRKKRSELIAHVLSFGLTNVASLSAGLSATSPSLNRHYVAAALTV